MMAKKNTKNLEAPVEESARSSEAPPKMRRVVCAANRHEEGDHVLGARHFDAAMRTQYEGNFRQRDTPVQGFIDQHCVFMTRTEAWKVACDAGQILYRCGGDEADGGTLYSENLY